MFGSLITALIPYPCLDPYPLPCDFIGKGVLLHLLILALTMWLTLDNGTWAELTTSSEPGLTTCCVFLLAISYFCPYHGKIVAFCLSPSISNAEQTVTQPSQGAQLHLAYVSEPHRHTSEHS